MAGFFGLFDFTREGPGVETGAPPLKGIRLFFRIFYMNFWKLITLNLIFIAFCIPVATIPAAMSGMVRVLRDMVDEKLIFPWLDFWKAFKSNFLISFLYGILVLIVAVLFYLSVPYYLNNGNNFIFIIFGGLFLLACFIFLIISLYVPLMIVSTKLGLMQIINNAFRLTFIVFFRNFLTVIITAVPAILMAIFFPATLLIVLLLFFSAPELIICFRCWPIIKKYVIAEGV